jgi:SpoVK/Ycf46/Vps4 family AAA+-type ATPase
VDDGVVGALRRAVAASPDDLELRLHLAETLLANGERGDAVTEAANVLAKDSTNLRARDVMTTALQVEPVVADPREAVTAQPVPEFAFDWDAAEQQVDAGTADAQPQEFVTMPAQGGEPDGAGIVDTWSPFVTLADVGGMQSVKDRLDAAFLAPLRNPELRAMYGATLRGGLLMYGPPGCGKTFLARAVAGELDAAFLSVALHDVLDPMMGVSEQRLHEAFEFARASAPCVLFLDEVDALGQRRSHTRNSGMRGVVVQLLEELDGMSAANDGVFILAATNQPWDIDPALRRPGRLDRTLLVLPPDHAARRAIFELHLRDRPVDGIDSDDLAKRTDGYTGADIAHICSTAAENALMDSVKSGSVRRMGQADLVAALGEVRSSATGWFDSVRNLVLFGDDDGTFEELRAYLKKNKRL